MTAWGCEVEEELGEVVETAAVAGAAVTGGGGEAWRGVEVGDPFSADLSLGIPPKRRKEKMKMKKKKKKMQMKMKTKTKMRKKKQKRRKKK